MNTNLHKSSRRGLWILNILILGLIIALSLFVLLLPQLSRWAVLYGLEQQGYETTVKAVETKLLAGRISFRNVLAEKEGQRIVLGKAQIMIDWQALIDRHIKLLTVQLERLEIEMARSAKKAEPGTAAPPQSNRKGIDWLLGLGEFQLSESRFCYGGKPGPTCVSIDKLNWQGDMRLDLGKLTGSAQDLPLKVGASLSASGVHLVEAGKSPWMSLKQLRIDKIGINTLKDMTLGKVVLEQFVLREPEGAGPAQSHNERLSFTTLKLDKADLSQPAQDTGKVNQKSGAIWKLAINQIGIKGGRFCYTSNTGRPCLRIENLQTGGTARLESGKSPESVRNLPVTLAAELKAEGLRIAEAKQAPLLSLQQLQAKILRMNTPAEISLEGITASEFIVPRPDSQGAPQDKADVGHFAALTINQAGLRDLSDVEIDQVVFNGLGADIRRQQDGQWQIVRQLQPLFMSGNRQEVGQPDKVNDNTRTVKAPQFRLNQLLLENSDPIFFEDATLKTPFSISLQQSALTINDIDSRQPGTPTRFSLDTLIQEHGKLHLSGDVQPFRDQLFFNVESKLSGIDLRPASPYLDRYLGHRVKSGQISGSTKLGVTAGKLDGLADVELRQFYLEVSDQQQADQTASLLGTPLTASLALLREEDKSIKLKVPVSGDITDPQFSSGNIFQQLTIRVINEAVKNYYIDYGLALAGVGQYSLAVKGASKIFGFLNKLRFNPVVFNAGQSQLNAEQQTYLDSMVRMLDERPEVHLTLCGYATLPDLQYMTGLSGEQGGQLSPDEQQTGKLLQLANQRAANIKDYLVNQQAVKPERLIVCEGKYETGDDRQPRVEINI